MKLRDIKGIGPKTEELFHKVGVFTAEDLVRYYPLGYDEYTAPIQVGAVCVGQKCAVRAAAGDVVMRHFQKMTIVTTTLADGHSRIRATWFNAPFIASVVRKGTEYIFRGTVREKNGQLVMDHPEIITPEKYASLERSLVPVYGLTKGLTGKMIAKAVREVLDKEPSVCSEFMPESFLHLLGFMDETEALRKIHFPENAEVFEGARRRLVFDEFFLFIMAIRTLKDRSDEEHTAFSMKAVWDCEDVIAALPYKLTSAQMRAWREIESDLTKPRVMSRLLQGDVGSGKTIVAFLAMMMTALNGYQSAFMAPTEVLASQHYEKLMQLKEALQLSFPEPVLLTGSVKGAKRKEVLSRIESGEANAVIGTHALFQEGVEFKDLALVITDEQHRFGVRQREALSQKGRMPHTLVMSATPIPRTLGVIYYGDLDISVIDELPAKRLPIRNAVVDSSYREKAIRFIDKQIGEGRQAYVICPMIEPSEELDIANVAEEFRAFKKALPGRTAAALHGSMKPEEKNRVMEEFAGGGTDLLVSTTVVEVGVDVPNATVILIENAERFGLAQLHQLRGRVGRGEYQSYCIFMAGQDSEKIRERLQILKDSDDGFVIAEKDFLLRGPGDLLGIRQSGDARFALADPARDADILRTAGEAAASFMADDPGLLSPPNALLKERLNAYLNAEESNMTL